MSPSLIAPTFAEGGSLRVSGEAAGISKPRWSRQVAADVVGLFDALAIACSAMLPATIYSFGGDVDVRWTQVVQNGLLCGIVACFLLRSWGMYDTTKMNSFPIRPQRLLAALLLSLTTVHGLGLPFKAEAGHLWPDEISDDEYARLLETCREPRDFA